MKEIENVILMISWYNIQSSCEIHKTIIFVIYLVHSYQWHLRRFAETLVSCFEDSCFVTFISR